MDEIIKALAENKELSEKLEDMWKSGVEPSAIVDAMAAAGIEASADEVESMLHKLQLKSAAVISAQELDDDELDQVAGGGTGNDCSSTDDCDRNFKYPLRSEAERCDTGYFCDEYYKCDNDWSCTSAS